MSERLANASLSDEILNNDSINSFWKSLSRDWIVFSKNSSLINCSVSYPSAFHWLLNLFHASCSNFWDLIFIAAEKIDEPVADYAILPTLKLSEKASEEFKVVLTGEGGDELFGGYNRHNIGLTLFRLFSNMPSQIRTFLIQKNSLY